jgi:hypothetical protein
VSSTAEVGGARRQSLAKGDSGVGRGTLSSALPSLVAAARGADGGSPPLSALPLVGSRIQLWVWAGHAPALVSPSSPSSPWTLRGATWGSGGMPRRGHGCRQWVQPVREAAMAGAC